MEERKANVNPLLLSKTPREKKETYIIPGISIACDILHICELNKNYAEYSSKVNRVYRNNNFNHNLKPKF